MSEMMTKQPKKTVGPRRKRATRERVKAPPPEPKVETTELVYPVEPQSLYDLEPGGFYSAMPRAMDDFVHNILERFDGLEILDQLKSICDDLGVEVSGERPAGSVRHAPLKWWAADCSTHAEYLAVCFLRLQYVTAVWQAAPERSLHALVNGIMPESGKRIFKAIETTIKSEETSIFECLRSNGKMFEAIAERLGHPLRKSYTIASHPIRPLAGTVAARH